MCFATSLFAVAGLVLIFDLPFLTRLLEHMLNGVAF
jgi:hypothetical protein